MKRRRIKWYVLGAVVLLIAVCIFWQLDNIKAGLLFTKYSQSELEGLIAEKDAAIDVVVEKVPEVSIKPLTEDERQMLREGTLDEEEAVGLMLGEGAENAAESETTQPVKEDKPTSDAASPSPEAVTPTPDTVAPAPEADAHKKSYARISELIARVYVMRDSYVSKLEGIKSSAIAEYTALPAKERTSSAKRKLLLRCIDEASALENACDSEMTSILSELTSLLKEVGGDTSIASDIKAYYAEEKAVKKAYYMNLYS